MATLSAHSSPSPGPNSDPNMNSNPNSDFLTSPPPNADNQTNPTPPPALLHVSFNQDYGCFVAGTSHGFRIYNCDPFHEIYRRDLDLGGGIGVVEMLFRCNIMALIGGGTDPQYPLNMVTIWDENKVRCVGSLSFRSEVLSVKLRRDRITVVLEEKISVYDLAKLKILRTIETIANPKGLCAVSQGEDSLILVCPGLKNGQVRVEHHTSKTTMSSMFITAHDSNTKIACLALTQDGQLFATASTKGNVVRIFNSMDATLLQEVTTGTDRAEIYSMAFSSNAKWLAVSSDKGIVRVFNAKVNSLSFIRKLLHKFFGSELSIVAQFSLVEGSPNIVGFGQQENTVVILSLDGSFYRCQFDPVNGGEMTQVEHHNFLNPQTNI